MVINNIFKTEKSGNPEKSREMVGLRLKMAASNTVSVFLYFFLSAYQGSR